MSRGDSRGGEPRERTEAEREAARLERERRRAERTGEYPAAVEPERPADEPVFGPATPGTDPARDPADPATPPIDVASSATDPATTVADPAATVAGLPVDQPAVAFGPANTGELPSGVNTAGTRPAGVRVGSIPVVPRRRRRPRYLRRACLLLPLIVLLLAGYLAYRVFQPLAGSGSATTIRLVIPKGATVSDIAELLEREGVIDSATFFEWRARLSSHRSDLKAGAFFLREGMSYSAAIAALTSNPIAPASLKVMLPEGLAIREAAPLVYRAGVHGSYRRAAGIPERRAPLLTRLGAPRAIRTLEGLVFPASYELPKGGTAAQLVDLQLKAFSREFNPTRAQTRRSCRGQRLSPYEVVIVASMVEREAQLARERPLIAAVVCNRLRSGTPLGIDATIRYAVRNWSRPLTRSQLAISSPYNTRLHKGLPPTPIGAPGAPALKAALKPARTDYRFYVVKPCGNGAHAFSATEAQFQRDVDAYNKKRAQLGGKDPSTCK